MMTKKTPIGWQPFERACNILYNAETAKLANFECAQYTNCTSTVECCPPKPLSAPEMFSSTNPQSSHPKNLEKVDIWSFGVLIFEILSNCLKPNPSWDVNYPPASEDISLTPIYETLTSTGNGWKEWDKFPFSIERNFQNVAIVDKLWKTCDGCMIFDPEKRLSHGNILSTLSFLESINS